jgi:hypothetical protein
MRVLIDPHCRRRMQERGVSADDMAQAWLHHDTDRPSVDHPGARVRTAARSDGRRVTVVARQTPEELYFITVWVD